MIWSYILLKIVIKNKIIFLNIPIFNYFKFFFLYTKTFFYFYFIYYNNKKDFFTFYDKFTRNFGFDS